MEFILPLGQLLPVADDGLGAEPVIRRQRHKDQVHVGCLLIHMNHSGNIGSSILLSFHKLQGMVEEFFDFPGLLAFKELRAGGDQNLHSGDAVLPDPAAGFPDDSIGYIPVFPFGLHRMEIQPAPLSINIRIAGIGILGSLIVSLDTAQRGPLVSL